MDFQKEMEVNGLIREYLVSLDYPTALHAFDVECSQKGKPAKSATEEDVDDQESRLLHSFDTGDHPAFFTLWSSLYDTITKSSSEYQSLEFHLQIYFAIYPIHPSTNQGSKTFSVGTTMQRFKTYLTTRAPELETCKTAEFLPFYALPYVGDPLGHPSFGGVFEKEWVEGLRERLRNVVGGRPRLVRVLESGSGKEKKKVEELEERERGLVGRFRALQNDYHNLITISSELVQTLTACINGEKITPSYLAGVCQRLATFKQGKGKGEVIPPPQLQPQPHQHAANHAARAADSHEFILKPIPSKILTERLEQYLNYEGIANDLVSGDGVKTAGVVKGLRCIALHAQTSVERRKVLDTYVAHDLLKIGAGKSLIPTLLTHPNIRLQTQTAKLLNTISSTLPGRLYLLTSSTTTPTLSQTLSTLIHDTDTPLRLHLLITLQKLSLHRKAQTQMTSPQTNTSAWLHTLLTGWEDLPSPTLRYATALLMNLSLRTAGRKRILEAGGTEGILRLLGSILECGDPEVRTFVNGTLYSLFGMKSVREWGRRLGMEDLLKYVRGGCDEVLVRQIDFVLGQLGIEDHETEGGENDDNEDAVSEDGEDEDEFEFEDEEEDDDDLQIEDEDEDGLDSSSAFTALAPYKLSTPNRPIPDSIPRKISHHHHAPPPVDLPLRRPLTPSSRPGTPTPRSRPATPQTYTTLQRGVGILRGENNGGLVGNFQSSRRPSRSDLSVTGAPTNNDRGGSLGKNLTSTSMNKSKSKSKGELSRGPKTDQDQNEVELAFTARPRIARTPLPTSRRVSMASTVSVGERRIGVDDGRTTGRVSQLSGR